MTNPNETTTKTWQVLKTDDRSYYLVGMRRELTGIESLDARRESEPGLFLLARHEEGDCDAPHNAELMLSALYDTHQCYTGMKTGDTIETPHGIFRVDGVHVEPVASCYETKTEAKARRARLRRAGRKLSR